LNIAFIERTVTRAAKQKTEENYFKCRFSGVRVKRLEFRMFLRVGLMHDH
jgi:hypothetical protein